MWDLLVSVPDHCLSFYFLYFDKHQKNEIHSLTRASVRRGTNTNGQRHFLMYKYNLSL